MGKKCCVYGCQTNFKLRNGSSEDKLSVYRFPTDEDEKRAWISAIPNDKLVVSKDSVVCALHWPSGFETVSKKGKLRPKHPPSVWPNVPLSQMPTPSPSPRTTKLASCSKRNIERDQLEAFTLSDSMTFSQLKEKLLVNGRDMCVPVIAFMDGEVLNIQSKKLLNSVPLFLVRIFDDPSFENFI